MSEREALIRAIRANPNDDVGRLVFADWLQEQGNAADEARAEFIRTQIARSQLPTRKTRWANLARRERQLLEAHGRDWLAPFEEYIDVHRFDISRLTWSAEAGTTAMRDRRSVVRWDRGFLASAWTTPARFARYGETAAAIEPFTDVRMRLMNPSMLTIQEIEESSVWESIISLVLHAAHPAGPGELLTSSKLAPLESLELFDVDIRSWADRAERDHLPSLSRLSMNQCFVQSAYTRNASEAGYADLFRAPFWSRLRHLSIEYCYFWAPALTALVQPPLGQALESLTIIRSNQEDSQAESLAAVLSLPRLRSLTFSQTRLNDSAFATALESVQRPAPLESLDLSGNSMDTTITVLCNHPLRTTLKVLNLPRMNLNRTNVRRLISAFPRLHQLKKLSVPFDTDSGVVERLEDHFGETILVRQPASI